MHSNVASGCPTLTKAREEEPVPLLCTFPGIAAARAESPVCFQKGTHPNPGLPLRHYIVSRTYDTIWKRGEEIWWRVSRQDLPSAESTDNKSSTRTCFFLIIQRGRVAAISQSSLSCTPRTSLPSQQLLKNALEENARCKSQVLSSSAHLHN